MVALSPTHIVHMAAVLDMVQARRPVMYVDHVTGIERLGPVDIAGLGGNTTDVTETTVIFIDSLTEWELPLVRVAEMHSRGAFARYRP